METDALIVHKHDASKVLSILKDNELLDDRKKITHKDDNVIIPILEEIDLHLIENVKFQVDKFEFEKKSKPPRSLKEAMVRLVPDINQETLQTSYDQIGDIAIIDLNYELEPFKKEVGEAIMWSNPSISTVFNKSSKVEGQYRLRQLELIGGENKTKTVHKEHGIRFVVDVEKAYFSPRLATEHDRIGQKIDDSSTVLDMFGGIAPFAFHITKSKKVHVDTVDINPNTSKLIKETLKMNKIKGSINIICEDARKFASENDVNIYDYIIMNHPSGAFDYLDEALKLAKKNATIFYYDFVEITNYKDKIQDKLSEFDGIEIIDIHIVRQSSPSEYHVAVELINTITF